ncbi:MAG: dihydroxy-acid dehydratase, partial [Candidatus Altiarchaeales archaeon]
MRSDKIKKGVENAPHRAMFYATGITKEEMDKPFIGVASSYNDIIPGHVDMRILERFIEKGVHAGGGWPFIFGVPGICDGIAMGHEGMRYSLPSRELIADIIEIMAKAHAFDGLVLLTNCDKITPGMLMGAARLNIPSIVVTAGPMMSGNYKGGRLSYVRDTFEAVAKYNNGVLSEEEVRELEIRACPGGGSCQGLYTANTMACVTEALGMSLVGCATALNGTAKKKRIAFDSGKRIVQLIKDNITPRMIMNRNAFENAIMIDMAMGGSTNTVLHIPAIAHEAEVELPLEIFDEISRKTPHITNIRPGGDFFMEDIEYAGGIPAVFHILSDRLNDNITV